MSLIELRMARLVGVAARQGRKARIGAPALSWCLIGASLGLLLLAAAAIPMRVDWPTFAQPALATALLLALALVYWRNGRDPRIAAMAHGAGRLVAFSAIGAPLSYAAAAAGAIVPLQDRILLSIDRSLGFDWLAYARFADASPLGAAILGIVYNSLIPQLLLVIIIFSIKDRIRLEVAIISFFLCTLIVIFISMIIPSTGYIDNSGLKQEVFNYINVEAGIINIDIVKYLRNGSMNSLISSGSEGIITFPSLHTSIAVLVMIWFWPLRIFRIILILLNTIMLASIPAVGGHYLVDMLAGAAIALVAWRVAHRLYPSHPRAAPMGRTGPSAEAAQGAG